MSLTAIARRYADALADVAFARNEVETVAEELGAFADMMKASDELRAVFSSPVVAATDKAKVLDALIARTGPGALTANLLGTLLRNARIQHLDAIRDEFAREIERRQGIVAAEVTTAAPLAIEERQLLTSKLAEALGGRTRLEFRTDDSLIGGIITRIGSTVYDGSIRTRLESFKKRMKQGEFA